MKYTLWIVAIFVLGLVIFIFIGYNRAHRLITVGDEPHYLIMSNSLIKDGDFDLKNNYENKDYQQYGWPTIDYQNHISANSKNGKYYSLHNIGLPILISPGYIFGKVDGSIVVLNIIAAIAGVFVFALAYKITESYLKSLIAWSVIFLIPISLYSSAVYTEIPLFAISIILLFLLFKYSRSQKTILLIIASFLLSLLIWLHVKYVFVSASFIIAYIFLTKNDYFKNILILVSLPLLSQILEMFVFHKWFGVASLTAAYPNLWQANQNIAGAIIEGIPGLLIDRAFGLFLYSPVFILSFSGLYFLFKENRRIAYATIFIFLINFLAFGMYVKFLGFVPVGRFVMPVMGIMVLWLIFFIKHLDLKNIKSIIFYFLLAVSLFFSHALIMNPIKALGVGDQSNMFSLLPGFMSHYQNIFPNLIGRIDNFEFPRLTQLSIFQTIGLLFAIFLINYFYIRNSIPVKREK